MLDICMAYFISCRYGFFLSLPQKDLVCIWRLHGVNGLSGKGKLYEQMFLLLLLALRRTKYNPLCVISILSIVLAYTSFLFFGLSLGPIFPSHRNILVLGDVWKLRKGERGVVPGRNIKQEEKEMRKKN